MTGADPAAVLADLPDVWWPPLLQAVRTAADRLGRAQLPTVLQPYAGFTPARLGQGRAKAAVVAALAEDARLRDAVGAALGDGLWDAAEHATPAELVSRFGTARAVAALVARARWDDAASVDVPDHAPQRPAASGASRRSDDRRPETATLRRERDAAQRRAAAAEKRAGDLQQEMSELRRRIADLEAERDSAVRQAADDRSRSRDRLARLQRRVGDAEARARAEAARFAEVAGELDRLAALLRGETPAPDAAPPGDGPAPAPAIPRVVAAATPGRPCILPAGLTDTQPAAVESLLSVPGVEVILDGYNVTKDLRGVPAADLADQRAWLVRVAAAAAAGRDLRMTIVFDGAGERTSAAAVARVVRCVFTSDDETADERIVSMVTALPLHRPVVVVTSDLQVRTACVQQRANVIASGVFLAAVA